MLSSGFKINECDKCVYTKSTQKICHCVSLCRRYVDHYSNHERIQSTKKVLISKFDMKDLRVPDMILGIKISRTSEGYILSQTHYVEKILEKYNKGDLNVARTIVDLTLHLSKNTGSSVSQLEYSRIIGILMYLTNCTRSDIVQAVNKLSRYTSNP